MTTALRCPTCSAPLDPPAPGARTVACAYCGANAVIAERLGTVEATAAHERRSDDLAEVVRVLRETGKIAAIKVYRERFGVGLKEAKEAVDRIAAGQPEGTVRVTAGQTTPLGCLVGVLFLVGLGAGLWVWLQTPSSPAPSRASDAVTAPSPERSEFAVEVLRFGNEGTGAGRFEDARSVALDGEGRIYVAEYQSGRVQVFDSTGAFQTQWMLEPNRPLLDLITDREGSVYVAQGGYIRRHDGQTGEPLAEIARPGSGGIYSDLALALDGSLWAVARPFGLVHLDRTGRVLQRLDAREVIGDRAHPSLLAVSGTGELYVADQVSDEIYRLDAEGRFVDRFGGRGDRPDQLRMPQALVLDGRGRLFVSDPGNGIRVFTADGHFLGAFGGDYAVVFGLAVDDHDQLVAAFRNDHQIVKYRLKE